MSKTIFISGATDRIGFATAEMLLTQGHHVLLHGRNPEKLERTKKALSKLPGDGCVESYLADLSHLPDVAKLAQTLSKKYSKVDVLINNARIFKTTETRTADGLDVRFVVKTLAPYLLTKKLLPLLGTNVRVINLSSAAQSTINLEALSGHVSLTDDYTAYAQSKLALTMSSHNFDNDKGRLRLSIRRCAGSTQNGGIGSRNRRHFEHIFYFVRDFILGSQVT